MKDYIDQPNQYLTQKIIDAIFWVNTLFRGKVTFCGSVGLVINNYLHRPIHDIDCITEENWYGAFFEGIGQYGLNTSNSEKFEVNGVQVCVFKLLAPNGVTVDVMYRQDGCKSREVYLYDSKVAGSVKVEVPESAMFIKRNYLDRVGKAPSSEAAAKHQADLEYIEALLERKRRNNTKRMIDKIEDCFDSDSFPSDDIDF